MTVRRKLLRASVAVAVVAGLWSLLLAVFGGVDTTVLGARISANNPLRPLLISSLAWTVFILAGGQLGPLRRTFFGAGSWTAQRARIRSWFYRSDAADAVAPPTRPVHVLWATLGLCVFGAVLLREQLLHMFSVSDLGDPLFSVWRIGWVFHKLQGDPRALFDANIFYPHPLTFTYSDSMLLPSLVAAPLLAVGIHPVVVYNLLFLGSFVASGVAMFLLVSRISGSRPAAFVAALIFGFYPFRFEHYSHFELQMSMWMPITLLALHRFAETTRLRYALGAAAGVVAQFYSSMYFGVFLCLYVVPIAALLLLLTKRPPIARLLRGAAIAVVLVGVSLVPLALPYRAAQAEKGERDIPVVTYYSAQASDYLEAHDRSAMYGDLIRSEHPERALFPGAMAIGLTAASLLPPLGPMTTIYGAGLWFAWESSRGFNGSLYPMFYETLSPVRGLRVAARFSMLVGMTLAVLAGFGARRLLRRCAPGWKAHAMLGALVVLIGVDLHPRLGLEPVWPEPPPIYDSLPKSPKTVLAEYPVRDHMVCCTESLPFMYFSVWHWTNMVNGYSGFSPRDYTSLVESIEPIPAQSAIDALRAAGVTHVSINCALYFDPNGCKAMVDEVEDSRAFRRIVQTRWRGAIVGLYELR